MGYAREPDDTGRRILCAAAIAVLTVAVFAPAVGYPFASYDDPVYVTENPPVLEGLSWGSLAWAFTSSDASNWHPVTWISHIVDVQLFGLRPGLHHLVSVLIHGLNAALLFWLLASCTGATGRSALVAGVFALHPLRVESVAWIAERKDVLSGVFLLLTMLAYVAWTRRPGAGRYGVVAALFALALMSKPMAVTGPALLLLLDVWPLRRLGNGGRRLLLEKLPLAAMSLAAAWVTLAVQKKGGALDLLAPVPFAIRVQNALVSYGDYLLDFVWPAGLAPYYPYRLQGPTPTALAAACLLFAALTFAALKQRRPRPWLVAGWGWYLVALLPVAGLIQAGGQARADRYSYVPLTGIAVALVWSLPEMRPRLAAGLSGVALVLLATLTTLQLRHWRDDIALWGHTVAVTQDNEVAHNNLGLALARAGRYEEAAMQHREAIRIRPDWSEAYKFHAALAFELMQLGRPEAALAEYREVLRREPAHRVALNDVGVLLAGLGRPREALEHYERAVATVPDDPQLRLNLAAGLEAFGRPAEAAAQLTEVLRLRPDDAVATERLRALRLAGVH